MSQKKKHTQQATPAAVAPQPESPVSPGPEHLRRVLLGMVTALVVARPLVLGEDPGMLAARTGTSHLVLTLLWFLTAVGWAGWRWWSRNVSWHAGIVEAALLVASLAVAFSSLPATYKHPAILIAWEWFALFVGLFLVRQLATTASDQRHLLAAFLASVVSLSAAYAVFQTRHAPAEIGGPARQAVAIWGNAPSGPLPVAGLLHGVAADESKGTNEFNSDLDRKLEQGELTAAFVYPSSFAGYLVLFLPALATAAFLQLREKPRNLQALLSAACVLLAGLALLLTRAGQGGMLGLAVVSWIAFFRLRWKGGPGGLLALVAVGFALFALWQFPGTWADSWTTAWAMIRAFPWLGAGAGNYGRLCPQFLQPGGEPVDQPGNFALELWATSGIFALLAILIAFGAFFWLVLRRVGPAVPKSQEKLPDATEPVAPEKETTRWEFYLAGMAGLLLGYILRQTGQSPDDALRFDPSSDYLFVEGAVTAFRSVIWFAAFALFETVRWPGRTLSGALAAGVFALLAQLSVAGGINFPSLATPLWLAVGLALAGLGLKAHESARQAWLPRIVAIPVTLGFLIAFVLYPFDPVMTAMDLARSSALAEQQMNDDRASRSPAIRDPRKFFVDRVSRPLHDAVKADPTNSRWYSRLSSLYGRLWNSSLSDPKLARDFGGLAVEGASEAQRIDERGPDGYVAAFRLRMLFEARAQKPDKKRQLELAADALRGLANCDPTNPWGHYRLARMLFEAVQPEKARQAAQDAREADRKAPQSPRRLGDWQRYQAERWADGER